MMLGAPNVKAKPVKVGSPILLLAAVAAASFWFFRRKRR